jgi:phosphopantetheinyl transferase
VIRVESPIQISESCRLWIGSVAELPTSFPDGRSQVPDIHVLSLAERDRLQRYRVPQKKWQFLLSRRFARDVLDRQFGSPEVRLEMVPGGGPILRGDMSAERFSVSLSHSDCLFAMVIGAEETAVGVDIEAAEPLDAAAFHALLQPSCIEDTHQISMPECRNSDQLRLEWTGREALWKALGGPVGYTVLQMPVVANTEGLSFCGDQFGPVNTRAGLFGFQSGIPSLSQSAMPITVSPALTQSFCGCVVELKRMGSLKLGDVAAFGRWNSRSFHPD